MDDYLKAEAAFVTALALHQLTQPRSTTPPTRIEIIRGLAALLFKEGRYADAAAQFVSLSEMDKNPATKNINKFMTAQALTLRDLSKESFKQLDDSYTSLAPEEKVNQKINYVDTLLRGAHYDQALVLLNEIAGAADTKNAAAQANNAQTVDWLNDPFYYICLSRAYLGKNDLDKAEDNANKAIALCDKENAPHSDAFCQLADVLYAKGDMAGAEKNANNALGVNAKAFRAYYLLGNIAIKQNQPKLAVEAANKALETNPYFIDGYLLLGEAQSAQGDYKAALSTYHKAVDLYPSLIRAHQSLLSVLK